MFTLLTWSVLTMVPFVWLLCGAFRDSASFGTSTFLPTGDGPFGVAWNQLTFDNFRRLEHLGVYRAFLNSTFLSSTSALLATFGSALGGYALAKHRFRGRNIVLSIVLLALVIPGALVLAPGYQVAFQLRILDSYGALILPSIAPAFGVFLFRQAILHGVPDELLESARLDGAGEFRIFVVIVLPLVKPMVGAFLMITFLGTWNNFILPQVMLQSPDMFPLSVAVNQLRGMYAQDYGLIMAGTMISILPLLSLFLLLQRDFIAGLTAGAVKG